MVTNIKNGTFDFCETLTDDEDALARAMLERASAKWPLRVMHILAEAKGPLRFSRVLERVEGISQKVLTQTLRTLEADGLVTRTLYPQVPPRVEYELTPLGGELLVEVVGLWQWIANRLPDFEAARKAKGQTENGPKN
ncbi:helix-turn-helix domain-containing protein [Rhizobium sp. S152]|uniref:winged helix-turn-helix transcriptional regulator n=1 Tax=Rhizobium sp. S152 TaxID=3055038 RepID=UPI0025A98926|nr:helix-turn-helix domain-containing protein [Rhizobium sp. S152]MDM9626949.1 helix-turn-helix domain-containing protein [Rhizobium sp. S152]